MGKKEVKYLLKKLEDGQTVGPLTKEGLKELAQSARVAPGDQITQVGKEDKWQAAPRFDFLEMHWVIPREGHSEDYGPTTLGTLQEFVLAGEIDADYEVLNTKTGEKKQVLELAEVQTDKQIATKKETMQTDLSSPKPPQEEDELEPVMETARELRIRQLEYDIEDLNKKHEALLQKFRRLSEQSAQKK